MKKASEQITIKGFDGKFIFNAIPTSIGLELNKTIEDMIIDGLAVIQAVKNPLITMFLGDDAEDKKAELEDDIVTILQQTDINDIVKVLKAVFNNMDKKEFIKFAKDLLSHTTYVGDGAQQIDAKFFEDLFGTNIGGIYLVMFEAMKFYNFTPFVLASLGLKTPAISG